jgi:hypothetical protein
VDGAAITEGIESTLTSGAVDMPTPSWRYLLTPWPKVRLPLRNSPAKWWA